jgi:predicted amidohydrolase
MQDLKLTCIQSDLNWESPSENLAMFSEKIEGITESTDIIVLPEMFPSGFTMNVEIMGEEMNGSTFTWLEKQAKITGCVITGSLIVKEKGNHFNRLVWMQPDGNYYTYDKRHLFRMMNEDNYFKPGQTKLIVEWKGWRICPLICYDLRFPVWSRNTGDYDCLIYIANWPEARKNAWSILLQARAHENQAYVVGVNRVGTDGNNISFSGNSAVIDPKGEMIAEFNSHEEDIKTSHLSIDLLADYKNKFPAGLDADKFKIEVN